MATIRKVILTKAEPEDVWDAIRDIGALHTRLVRGFVTHARLEPGARIVTFSNGMTLREPIVTIDEEGKRLVWAAVGGLTTHYNAAVQVFADHESTRVVWTADFLPDEVANKIDAAMEAGALAMKATLDGSAERR